MKQVLYSRMAAAALLALLSCGAGYVPVSPDSVLHEKALRAMGRQDYRGAKLYFLQIIDEFPEGEAADDALFHIGYLYVCHKNPDASYQKALDAFRGVVDDHPNSEWKYEALNWIQVLKSRSEYREKAAEAGRKQPVENDDNEAVERLTAENKTLKSENGRLNAENGRLSEENGKLKSVLEKLEAIDR